MSTTFSLQAASRTQIGKQSKALRRQGQIPAVVYGHKQESASLSVDAHDFNILFREAGTTTLIDLSVDGKAAHKVLIHDFQKEPVTGSIQHIDFYTVNMKEKLTTEVPLSFVGTAPAVEVEGGSLIMARDNVEVECLPQDLVPEIEVDIASLATFEDVIRVKDLVVPAGLAVLTDEEEMVASVAEPRSEEEMAELDEAVEDTAAEVEVENGGEEAAEAEAAEKE